MKAADHWETEAHRWVAWARAAGHDAYWYYHRKIPHFNGHLAGHG